MSNCSCIKREDQAFDFVLTTYDCKGLVFTDTTNWMEEDGYSVPTEQELVITLPTKNIIKTKFIPKSSTKISSQELFGYKCLPDGVYCFSTESCGYKYTRNKAVVCTLKCRLDNLIAKSEDWQLINKLSNLITSIEVSAEMGLELQAKELFKVVVKELDIHSCECSCR